MAAEFIAHSPTYDLPHSTEQTDKWAGEKITQVFPLVGEISFQIDVRKTVKYPELL